MRRNDKMKQNETKSKKQKNVGKLGVKVMAIILAAMMVLSVAASLIYYLVNLPK